jgi:hypothetical protein
MLFSVAHMPAMVPTHLFYLIIAMLFHDDYQIRSLSLWSYLQPPAPSSFEEPGVPSVLFSLQSVLFTYCERPKFSTTDLLAAFIL